ncbi:monooxygenase [Spirosoma sp. KCTC 42546]|uniref:FAD-dependent monooxygenase n=1 Tax=Spirosoma sp. KCTC 42546 TaxID=2520506 RepID=UPI00115A911F|nr:FAD-dependent monooxygenase [Spirosoma sp. KCTC 42546]QDK78586.1 monooxygenase [Spirosoma sp. KCTC 42546]
MTKPSTSFTILGGGIVGLTTALALQKIGIRASVFEAAPVSKPLGAGLALAANAIKAFQRLGIADEVVQAGRLLDAFTIYDQHGRVVTRTDSRVISQKYGLDNFSIHRAALHQVLLHQLDNGVVHMGKRGIQINQQPDKVIIQFDDDTTHEADYLLVADGIHSPIRQQLMPDSKARYAGYTCWRAVVDATGLNLSEASETWGTAGRVGVVPLATNQLYWFATQNAPANDSRMRARTPNDLLRQFDSYHSPIPDVIARTPDNALIWNDICDLKPLARYAFDKVVLLGDAAHATTPNLGQGACQAIEDAVVLADELAKGGTVPDAFKRFEQRRLKRTHIISKTSRRIGTVAQVENKFLMMVRNGLFRLLPAKLNERQLEMLYQVDF